MDHRRRAGVPLSGRWSRQKSYSPRATARGEPGEFSGMRVFTESTSRRRHNYPFPGSQYHRGVGPGHHIRSSRRISSPARRWRRGALQPVKLESTSTAGCDAGSLEALKPRSATTFTAVGLRPAAHQSGARCGRKVRMVAQTTSDSDHTRLTGTFSLLLSNNPRLAARASAIPAVPTTWARRTWWPE